MKKVLFVFSLVLVSIVSFAQVRLNEFFPNGIGNSQFFELFCNGTQLNGYKLLSRFFVKTGNAITDSGFYVVTIPDQNVTALTYWVGAQDNTPSPNLHWGTGTNVVKDKWNITDAPEVYNGRIFESQDGFVFLLKGNKIVDFVVSGSGSSTVIQSYVNSWANYNLGSGSTAITISFKNLQFNKFNTGIPNLGNNSASLIFESNNCSTYWKKSGETRGSNNASSNSPITDYWESSIQIPTNSLKTTFGDVSTTFNNTLPDPTFALNATKDRLTIRYELLNSNISSVSSTSPLIQIYTDKDQSGYLDTSVNLDINVSANILSKSYSGSTATIEIDLTSNMFRTVGSAKYLNSIFFYLKNLNNCFSSLDILRSNIDFLLPVTLDKFNLSSIDGKNKISWTTSSESNNKGFEVQRSIGSTNNFKAIGFVGTNAKQGNSQIEISYSFEDANIKAGEMHYYRLNQIDFDGKSALSPVKSIKPGSIASGINVYPNPSRGLVTVNTGSTAKMNMMLIDNTGRMVKQYNNVSGSNTQINNLKKGFYTLKIVDQLTGEQSAQRIVVQ